MSQLIGGALPQFILAEDDRKVVSLAYQPDIELHYWSLGVTQVGDYSTPWWPNSQMLDDASGVFGSMEQAIPRNALVENVGGTTSNYGISGITRDAYGSPVGGVTVNLFKTSYNAVNGIPANTLVDSKVSDAVGAFTVVSPYYPDAHYIVTYKAGSPDIFGTTVNTLIGA